MCATVPDRLSDMLTRLKQTAIRDQLDGLLDEAGRQELSLRETLVLLCEREITRKDERRIEMTLKLARFPFVRDLARGDSYRLKEKRRSGLLQKPAAAEPKAENRA